MEGAVERKAMMLGISGGGATVSSRFAVPV